MSYTHEDLYYDSGIYLMTDSLQEATKFICDGVYGDEKVPPSWLIDSINGRLSEKDWDKYAQVLKYWLNRGASSEILFTYFPDKEDLVQNSVPNLELISEIRGRSVVYFLFYLFDDIVLSEDELSMMSDELANIGDGPSYPRVLFLKDRKGNVCI